ncbi:hypothetical protein QJS66_09515 [Kocuria rhizophila]|nr:hypothetical protein QJS66_09515 [Kocuria rhizophila]
MGERRPLPGHRAGLLARSPAHHAPRRRRARRPAWPGAMSGCELFAPHTGASTLASVNFVTAHDGSRSTTSRRTTPARRGQPREQRGRRRRATTRGTTTTRGSPGRPVRATPSPRRGRPVGHPALLQGAAPSLHHRGRRVSCAPRTATTTRTAGQQALLGSTSAHTPWRARGPAPPRLIPRPARVPRGSAPAVPASRGRGAALVRERRGSHDGGAVASRRERALRGHHRAGEPARGCWSRRHAGTR